MKNHIRKTFKRYAKEYEVESKCREEKENEKATTLASRHRLRTGCIRGMVMDEVLSGRFPTDSFRNSYRTNDPNNYRGLHGNEHGGDSDSDLTGIHRIKLRKFPIMCFTDTPTLHFHFIKQCKLMDKIFYLIIHF